MTLLSSLFYCFRFDETCRSSLFKERWWRWSLKGNANNTGFLNLSKICFNPRLRNVSVLSALQKEFRRREVFLNFFSLVLFPWRKSTKKSRLQSIYYKTTHLKIPAIQAITSWAFMLWIIFSLSLFVDCLAQMALAIFKCLFCGVNALRSVLASWQQTTPSLTLPLKWEGRFFDIFFCGKLRVFILINSICYYTAN